MKLLTGFSVAVLIATLSAFIGKNQTTEGLKIGEKAPNIEITNGASTTPFSLAQLQGKYVLVNFWASYDAFSRMQNAGFSNILKQHSEVEFVSVSFDEYSSIFLETIRRDQVSTPTCFVDTKGVASPLFRTYKLEKGFTNYLLNEKGVIIAKDLLPNDLSRYISAQG